MQLSELKMLIEYEAIKTIMATKHNDGWVVVVIKNESLTKFNTPDGYLERARGGVRIFKTLDAVYKVMSGDLYYSKFLVA